MLITTFAERGVKRKEDKKSYLLSAGAESAML
jgi:hypothetical protein